MQLRISEKSIFFLLLTSFPGACAPGLLLCGFSLTDWLPLDGVFSVPPLDRPCLGNGALPRSDANRRETRDQFSYFFVSKPKWGNGKYNTHTLIYIPCFSNLSLIRVHSSLPEVVKPTKHYGSWLLIRF